MSLNSRQSQIIITDVQNAGLKLFVLQEELIDHICCEVETLMDGGNDFQEAYAIVKKHISAGMLQSIEKNTMLLIDKKYAQMKIISKISSNVSLALIALGTILKIAAVNGANVILVSGFVILCLAVIPLLLYFTQSNDVKNKKLLFKFSALTGSIAFAAGILFKVMNWQGANILLILAYTIILLIALPALLYDFSKNSPDVQTKRINTFGVISLMVFILSTMFKMFQLPGAAILMILGGVMIVSITLPLITYSEFKKTGVITGKYIFLIVFSIYIITMSMLMSFHASPILQDLISNR